MLLEIDKNGNIPVYDQLVNQIRNMVDTGLIEEGYQMPSSRQMAQSLGINRSTVVRAFDELWALGYLESSPGSYTRIRKRKRITDNKVGEEMPAPYGARLYSGGPAFDIGMMDRYGQLMSEAGEGIIDFYHLVPDPRLLDKKVIADCFRDALNDVSFNVFGYNHPRGYEPLRGVILKHMQLHSIHASDENILITNGSQNSLHLIFQAFATRGDVIAIESPTYAMLFPVIQYYGLEVIEIPTSHNGMDIDYLADALTRRYVRFIYTIPTFQNPTGGTMPQQKRERLLALCEKFSVLLIEDSIEEEMKYFGKVHLPIKSIDHHDHVIYLGSFSKVLAPGFRTGWVIAGKECIRRLTAIKTMTDLSSNTLSQVMLYRFCRTGDYELHIRRIMRTFRKRMKTALRALKQYMPADKVSWEEPLGGYLIWLQLEVQGPGNPEAYFLQHGTRITDGRLFFYTPQKRHYIRISISKCNEAEIEEGIRRLAGAIEDL